MFFFRVAALCAAVPAFCQVSFNRDIRPIMSDTCFRCHGPDKSSRMMNLRLDIREEATKRTRSGVTPIVPGDADHSAIIQRIFATDGRIMPPKSAHKELTQAQKETIRKWVAEGAKYEGHWAYEPIRRPTPPAGAANPIDAFIQARIAREGLKPAPEADRRTLIRRVSLDLTGLPPTPDEIHAFVKDTAPDAYERLVDRLLASPHYAEMRAMHWLDAVRYADTCGFHGDNLFPAWPYRDYVLRSFRDNKPFDVFTREQLAGDLVPESGIDQKIASAFNRLNRTSAEGGIQPKEYLAKYAADRARTVSAVWLGSTLGCAECHDHKFDPFTSRDFYSMEAFFADIKETGLVPDRGEKAWGSKLALYSDEQKRKIEELDQRIAAAKAALAPMTGEAKWVHQRPLSATAQNGAKLTIYNDEPPPITEGKAKPGEGMVVASGPNPDNETYTVTFQPGEGEWAALAIEIVPDEGLPGLRYARGADRLIVTAVEAETGGRKLPFALAASSQTTSALGLPPMAAIDGDAKTGWGIDTYGDNGSLYLALRFADSPRTASGDAITVRICHDSEYRRATIGRFRIALAASDVLVFPGRTPMKPERIAEINSVELAKLEAERSLLDAQAPRVVVTEAAEPRIMRVLPRGNWMDESGAVVEPAIPAKFGAVAEGRRASRLDLANWLTSAQNPLTARVFANRIWRQLFGTGISKVLEDVGSQGEWPVHPELLDWLASEFMHPEYDAAGAHDWDVKHLIRTIVVSRTYRQSSMSTPELAERDPDNRLLARQSRFRVDAEVVRDIALSASGLLSDKFGGPSARPYQPDGYLATLNFPKREYSASHGEELYRRGLYTQWQRTFLHPSLLTFDAPTREECTVNRVNSNTPLQALVLLNDRIYVEAARIFAAHMVESGRSLRGRIEWGFERALGRKPTDAERRILTALHGKTLARFRRADDGAHELLREGDATEPEVAKPAELAAMTAVARTILNLHETITRN